MPELLSSSLEARIERAVQAVIEERRTELERLVQAQVDQELEHLVAAEFEQRTNGNGAVHVAEPATRVCGGPCRRTLPVSAFEARRSKCRACRRREHLKRVEAREAAAQADTTEPPRSPE